MERIGVRELRQHASRYLEQVKRGETVEVTERGTLVARIVPPTPAESELERLIAEGYVVPARRSRGTLPRPSPARPGRPDSRTVLAEEREERR